MKDKKLSIRISEADLIKIHAKAAKSKLNFTQYVTKAKCRAARGCPPS